MIRCTLCLEVQERLSLDRNHIVICKQVFKLTGEDHQLPLLNYYEEHDIEEEFSWTEDNPEEGDEDNEKVYDVNSETQARSGEHSRPGNDQEQNEDSSSTPTLATMEVDGIITTAAEKGQVQESSQTWETLKPKKQDRSSRENTVPAPVASTKPESSKDFTFSQPVFISKQTEATHYMTVASGNSSDNERSSAFVFGTISASPFFGTPIASNDAESREGLVSPEAARFSEPNEAPGLSSPDKHSSQKSGKVLHTKVLRTSRSSRQCQLGTSRQSRRRVSHRL